MVYSIILKLTNNTPWGLSPANTATATSHGYFTGGPTYAKPNTADADAGTSVAAQNNWTGAEGIAVYLSPDPKQLLVLLGEMPYVGQNNCKVAVLPAETAINEDLVNSRVSKYGTSATFCGSVDGTTKNFSLNGSIGQGTEVTASFTFDVTN